MLAVLAVTAEAQQDDPINPILPVANEAVYAALFFAILWALVKYVLLPPVQKTLDDREERIRAERAAAEAARTGAGSVVSDFEEQLAGARAEAAAIVDAARAEAEAERQQIIAAVEAEVSAQRDAALAEIEQAKAQALAQMRPEVRNLAVGAASQVIGRPLDASGQRAIIDRYLDSTN
jgi:F-type H+-transporting ATPase subunit b